ncbi:MAG: DNA polymerase-3 subunit gamma/tau [Pseudohongiellaceae bacterium]|jgi:DNA polymerase-3 subunit gamma/tau
MSYQVLARKWRPKNFSQVAGQAHVLKSLINALDNERLHHAYLFTGTRGVGKTTLARILSKCLNCEVGVSSTPCETCDSCVEISEGRFIDLIEVDAASRTKVEDTRELLENVQYTPARGRYKVYLIDEVHMLSNHSFNALLKTLEEPPPHVKFLFATTDPHKLPVTILSRCLQFNLKNLSPKMIADYLVDVLKEEAIDYDQDAIWQIAGAASGSMRDALTLVDQAIAFCEGTLSSSGVQEMLGVPQQQQVFELLGRMARGDVASVLELVNKIAEQTPDYGYTLDALLSLLHRVALAQITPETIDNSFGDKAKVVELSGQIAAEDVHLYYQIGNKGREELRYSADVRAAFEMLLLRMMVFSPTYVAFVNSDEVEQEADLTADKLQSRPAAEKKKIADTNPAAKSNNESQVAHAPVVEADDVASEAVLDAQDDAIFSASSANIPRSEVGTENQLGSHASDKIPAQPSDVVELDAAAKPIVFQLDQLDHSTWLSVFDQLNVTGIIANVFANMQLVAVVGNEIQFTLDIKQSAVFNPEMNVKLESALQAYFSQPIKVNIAIAEVTVETPALLGQRLRAEKKQRMIDEFETDENVQELVARFSGSVLQDSIEPITKRGET